MNVKWEDKVWGRVAHLFDKDVSVSLLHVNAGFRCSMHYHKYRWNLIRSITCRMRIVCFSTGDLRPVWTQELSPGGSITIPPGSIHRFESIEPGTAVEIYWVSNGDELSIDDIERFDEGGPL